VLREAILPHQQSLRVLGSYLPAQLAFYAASTAATLVLAWLSWHLLEKRFLALKRHFAGEPSSANPAATARVPAAAAASVR
ncbi:MAG: hypothetical protein ICV87_08445, partial [Gemmatimonadetes bacterium]|nr:hypothetical protein [Gemmatimonadota bacterium]